MKANAHAPLDLLDPSMRKVASQTMSA